MKAPLAARPPIGVTQALIFAIFTPCSKASWASFLIWSDSLLSARAALIVLTADRARSTEADIRPTRSWALVVADLIFLEVNPIAATATEIISKVITRRSQSMMAMAITEPRKISAPPAPSTSP